MYDIDYRHNLMQTGSEIYTFSCKARLYISYIYVHVPNERILSASLMTVRMFYFLISLFPRGAYYTMQRN